MLKLFDSHESLHLFHDEKTKAKLVISICNTVNGASLGGIRAARYHNDEEAIHDAMRLSAGMKLKNKAAGLPFGGGKSVLILGQDDIRTKSLYEFIARSFNDLGGRYIGAEDVGTSVLDMKEIRKYTRFCAGLQDPAPMTAHGVVIGIEYVVKQRRLAEKCTMLVSGVGAVGSAIAKHFIEAGHIVYIYDTNENKQKSFCQNYGGIPVTAAERDSLEVDIYCPCAMANAITFDNYSTLKCRVVAGCANNQLESDYLADLLRKRNILYIPDFILNCGGVISVAHHHLTPDIDTDFLKRKIETTVKKNLDFVLQSDDSLFAALHLAN